MRRPTIRAWIGLASIAAVGLGISTAASALDRTDTMTDWLQASDTDRSHLLDDLQAKDGKMGHASRAAVLACMNGAAAIAGHGALPIGEVAEACSEPPAPDGGSSDI